MNSRQQQGSRARVGSASSQLRGNSGRNPSNPTPKSFVCLSLREAIALFYNETTTILTQGARRGALAKIGPVLPATDILNIFTEHVDVMVEQIGVLGHQNHELDQTRDLLLPRLTNGRIEV